MDVHQLLSTGGAVPLWLYLFLVLVTAAPMVPNAAIVAACGALAAQGRMVLPGVAGAVLVGTLAGDAAVYLAARWLWRRTGRGGGGRFRRVAESAAGRLGRHGPAVLIALRFVPGGRATGAAAAGLSRFSGRRCLGAAFVAEAAWTGTYVTIGYTGGALAPGPLPALAAATCLCALTGLVGFVLRRRRSRRAAPERTEWSDRPAPADTPARVAA
ncbi:DedA family protein [Amycolatopsis sp.]|uniref:DedA family protein n=1 Tax=Amycolatopsis sp. TaxID=37632 RepID=UPI002C6CEC55|nr:VTT domain-containing protein [Amycolatopsis sp.]HVV12234.1 VTT domain-containing protein [Amycolatopsis sp.]